MNLAAAALTLALVDAINLQFATGTSITNWHGQADVHAVTIEAARGNATELGVWASPQVIWQPRSWYGERFGDGDEKIYGMAIGGVIRRRLTSRFFVELSAGPMWTEKQVPAATSRMNFVTQPGAGFVIRRDSRVPMFVVYRFSHISNGGLSSRNPGWNVSSIGVGVTLRRP
ncbi:MAG TPA: acyloxyacyl hydrolase [Thermoanaerobaculia bacterium]